MLNKLIQPFWLLMTYLGVVMIYDLPWQINEFESLLASSFYYPEIKNIDLFTKALSHRSYIHDHKMNKINSNERLEFLGDAVLDLLISEKLYENQANLDEGDLSQIRSALVNEDILSELTKFTKLDKFLLLGKGEEKNGGRERSKNLSRVFEAIIGAIYLDSNYEKTNECLVKVYKDYEKSHNLNLFSTEILEDFDSKSELQEKIMKHFKLTPEYRTKNMGQGVFQTTLWVGDKSLGMALGESKKKAEKKLAKEILENQEIFKEYK